MKKGPKLRIKALSIPFPSSFGRIRELLRGVKANIQRDPDLEFHYDFSGGVAGKYAARYAERTNVVVLAPDVSKAFPNSDAVNVARRALMDGQQESMPSTPR